MSRNAQPIAVEIIADTFDSAADTFEQVGVDFYGPLARALLEGVPIRPGDSVLDVGCGRGACTLPAAAAAGDHGSVLAIDVAAAMVSATSRAAALAGLHTVRVEVWDADSVPEPARPFDVVVAALVLFMTPDPLRTITHLTALMRPGGQFAMSSFGAVDPAFFQVTDQVIPFLPHGLPPIPGREPGPFDTVAGIAQLLRLAGLHDVEVIERDFDLIFDSTDQWWSWLWQTAGRVVLDLIPDDRLGQAKAAATERMRQIADERGRLVVHWQLRFSYAKS